jgi:hypothetical protein
MIKVAITGKANSGKDTVGKIISKEHRSINRYKNFATKIALADPVKEIGMIMFPDLKKNIFFGPSENRKTEIPNSFKNDSPLTVRQLLIDIGTNLGRSYNENIWLDVFDSRLSIQEKHGTSLVIVTDVRFRNEFDHVKNKGFFTIRLKRDNYTKIDNVSETDQDGIADLEFDYVLNNNGTLASLKDEIKNKIMPSLKP